MVGTDRFAMRLITAISLLGAAGACSDAETEGQSARTDATSQPDTIGADTAIDTPRSQPDTPLVVSQDFGDPCVDNSDCESGWCVDGPSGYTCTQLCEADCPDGYICKSVLSASNATVFLCLPQAQDSCVVCADDFQCSNGACLEIDGGLHCAVNCESDAECPQRYECLPDPTGNRPGTFCLPDTGSCTCNAYVNQKTRSCTSTTFGIGTCYGFQACKTSQGWLPCTANTPTEELCDGLDNDCNGLIDDNLVGDGAACTNDVEGVGSCEGTNLCLGELGWVCQGQTPTEEVCDSQDNNCDGNIDEGFTDEDGNYTQIEHCGYCGNDCKGKILNGTGTCGGTPQAPLCVVDACDPGFVALSPFQCLPPVDLTCSFCLDDSDCLGGGCVELDGVNVCLTPCDPADGSCPDNRTCTNNDGMMLCQPDSGTCSCTENADGEQRPCLVSNTFGTCQGVETCDAAVGWVGCNAGTPADEICDGLDNDCDGVIDDGLPVGTPCQKTVDGVGTCDGVEVCQGTAGWTCTAATPEVETCDFKDNDCDGTVDNGFPDLYTLCSVGAGICQRYGLYQCTADGLGTECDAQEATAEQEVCDGLDNNCNGQTDEAWPDVNTICITGSGDCQNTGVIVCNEFGTGTECSAAEGNGDPEVCDNLDNDCNGLTDETFPIGQICYVGEGACTNAGTFQCAVSGTDVACSAQPGIGGVELCNSIDDDCDGFTDEDFKINDAYSSDTACGNCFTDCTKVYAPGEHPNAYGQCDSSGQEPGCVMTCCTIGDTHPECDGLFDYLDADGVPGNGCEFQVNPDVIYVSAVTGQDDAGCGDAATPCETITVGIDEAIAQSKPFGLYVSGGAYYEDLVLADGVSVRGGYNYVNWVRDPAVNQSVIYGSAGSGHRTAVLADGMSSPTLFDGFTIYASFASDAASNSYGVRVLNSTTALELSNLTIFAGPAAPATNQAGGINGAAGVNGGGTFVGGGECDLISAGSSPGTLIPDNDAAGITATISMSQDCTITSAFVDTEVVHGARGDLLITLTSPSGTTATLHDQTGGNANDVIDTFDVGAAFAGEQTQGTWTIFVSDNKGNNFGTLEAWGVSFNVPGPDPSYDAYETGGTPCSDSRQINNGGALTCGTDDVSGGQGGGNQCPPNPDSESSGLDGWSGQGGSGGLGGGVGVGGDAGDDGLMDSSGGGCACFLPSADMAGSSGSNGSDGGQGAGGLGCQATGGTVIAGHWAGGSGTDGIGGGNGGGGGGGGAGGGGSCSSFMCCVGDRIGAHGGGGGSGGCGGGAGLGGSAGGGSFGVLIVGGSPPNLHDTTIIRGFGGEGGSGGAGGVGGEGGRGAFGGTCGDSCWCFKAAGKGGEGGSGGHGGGGGGGCGGGSFGVYTFGVSGSPGYCGAGANNTFVGGFGGGGGAAGASLGQSGSAGATGALVDCSYN